MSPGTSVGDLRGVSVLVLGINYAPEVTGIGVYTTPICETLASQGADLTVLTAAPHYPEWQVHPGYGAARVQRAVENGVHLLRVRPYLPRRQTTLHRAAFEASWAMSVMPYAVGVRPDVVLSISPALAALPLGYAVARRQRASWGVVVQDLMGAAARNSGIAGGRSVAEVTARVEAGLLRKADLVGVIGPGFAASVEAAGVRPSAVRLLPNWTHITPSSAETTTARRRLGWMDAGLVVVHTGNMGAKQDLGNVVNAARVGRDRAIDVSFILVGDGSERHRLERMAQGLPNVPDTAANAVRAIPLGAALPRTFCWSTKGQRMSEMFFPASSPPIWQRAGPCWVPFPRTAGPLISSEPRAPHDSCDPGSRLPCSKRRWMSDATVAPALLWAAGRQYATTHMVERAAPRTLHRIRHRACRWESHRLKKRAPRSTGPRRGPRSAVQVIPQGFRCPYRGTAKAVLLRSKEQDSEPGR